MNKILIYNSGGGLGDSLQIIPLLLSLKNHYKKSKIYYLGAHPNHFKDKLKDYNISIETLELNLKYFGFRWWHFFSAKRKFINQNLEKIHLIIDLQSKLRNTIILKKIPHDNFYSSTINFKFCTKKAEYSSDNHLENLSNFLNKNITILKFNPRNLQEKYKSEAKRLLPDKNYIGFSLTQGNVYRKKSWLINNFMDLATKIGEKSKVPVFFIEKKEISRR